MTRVRLAAALAVLAGLAVVATAAIAVTTSAGQDGDDPTPPGPTAAADRVVVRDRATGASFEVPATPEWRVRGHGVRIYYTDPQGRPVATVHGPAVFRPGYCAAKPAGSNRAFVGFTRQPFAAWVRGITGGGPAMSTGTSRAPVELDDGTSAHLYRTGLLLSAGGACSAGAVEVDMVAAGDVRLVLARDTGEPGVLSSEAAEAVLTSLRLPD